MSDFFDDWGAIIVIIVVLCLFVGLMVLVVSWTSRTTKEDNVLLQTIFNSVDLDEDRPNDDISKELMIKVMKRNSSLVQNKIRSVRVTDDFVMFYYSNDEEVDRDGKIIYRNMSSLEDYKKE